MKQTHMHLKPKTVKLYAFSVYSSEGKLTQSHAPITKWLEEKLKDSKLDDRCMVLNSKDEDSDEDLIADYSKIASVDFIYGTLFRIAPSVMVPSISDELLKQSTISIAELESLSSKSGSKKAYKNHLYFYITDEIIITNTYSAKKLETYLNWYLEPHLKKCVIRIRPHVVKIEKTTLGSLKNIRLEEPKPVKKQRDAKKKRSKTTVKTLSILEDARDKVLSLLKNDYGLNNLTSTNFQDIVRVQLSILIAQNVDELPNEEVTRKTLESFLNIVDNEAMEFVKPDGTRIKAEEMHVRKDIKVDLNSNGFLNEKTLYTEMKNFRNEINNEIVY